MQRNVLVLQEKKFEILTIGGVVLFDYSSSDTPLETFLL